MTMKKFLLLFVFAIGINAANAQITDNDYKDLVTYLKSYDYKKAYKVSNKLLEKANGNQSEYEQMTAYINIYSATVLTSNGKMTRKELNDLVSKYKGQTIFMSGHVASVNPKNSLNKTFLSNAGDYTTGYTVIPNLNYDIMMTEDISFKEKLDLNYYFASTVRCGGKLTDYEVNMDETNDDWILKIKVTDAFIRRTK